LIETKIVGLLETWIYTSWLDYLKSCTVFTRGKVFEREWVDRFKWI